MYSHHFGLSRDPFSISPDPRFLYMSERHREALAHLLYGVAGTRGSAGVTVGTGGTADTGGTGGGFVLLTGDIGTGKTTICRCFLEQIPAGCHVAYIFNPKLTVAELLQSICEEFHIAAAPKAADSPSLKSYIDALNAFLLQNHAAGQSSVLVIDEAQNLSAEVLEQLRLLTNLETSERKLLQIILIGQPELRSMLAQPKLEQLAQRVIARFHLDALTEAESAQYIQHRLDVAGHTGPLPFDRQALQRIHRLARGVPRRINLLCGRAMLGAWANGLHRVSLAVVDKAGREVFGTQTRSAPVAQRRTVAYAGGALALMVGAMLALFLAGNPARQSALPMAAAPSPLPARAAVATIPVPASAPQPLQVAVQPVNPIEEIEAVLPDLPKTIDAAWRELAPTWKLPISTDAPCQAASLRQLQCFRTTRLSVPMLRQLNRSGILTLHPAGSPPVYAVLTGLNDQTATLQVAGKPRVVRLVLLGRLWRGDYATYWQPPPGYSDAAKGSLPDSAIRRLAGQLSQLDGEPPAAASEPQLLDAALRSRLRAFQRARGLPPNGQPGPMTFLHLDSATRADMPQLQTNPQ